jgi:hypothetical protein
MKNSLLKLTTFMLWTCIIFCLPAQVCYAAQRFVICSKNSDGTLLVKSRCRATDTRIRYEQQLNGSLIGFASITAGLAPVVKSFGGSRTTGVSVERLSAEYISYNVTFTGNFSNITNTDQVTPLVSVRNTETYDVASAEIQGNSSLGGTSITVTVYAWTTDSAPPQTMDRDFSIALLAH